MPWLRPRQVDLLDVLAAEDLAAARVPAYPMVAVQVGRRSGKTNSMLALAVGRAAAWPGYRVCYTAQTGLKSRDRFYDLYRALTTAGDGLPGWRARESRGEERIEFANGSVVRFGPPKGDTYRSDATDLAIVDEAQEHDPDLGAELLAAILPTMDTRPLSQLIVAGTAATDRDRLLWTCLQRARDGLEGWGIVEYTAAPTDDQVADIDTGDPGAWHTHHPGLADGLTTERKLRINAAELGPVLFAAEYLGVWPLPSAAGALPAALWAAAGAEHTDRPARFALGIDVAPDGTRAAVAAAWRPPGAPARVELLDARPGTGWVLDLVRSVAGARIPIGYDAAGRGVLDLADQLAATRPRPKLTGLDTAGYISACASLYRHLVEGQLAHPRQRDLDAAVAVAVRRPIGDAGWGWGRRRSGGDITPLVAATVALRTWDQAPATARPRIRVST